MPEDERFNQLVMDVELDELKEGELLRNWNHEKEKEMGIPISARHMHNFIDEMKGFYLSGKTPTKKQFINIFERHQKKKEDELTDLLDQLESEPEEMFKIIKRTKTKEGFNIEIKKIDDSERIKIIREICNKLIKKLKPEQLKSMFEEGIRHNNNINELKKINKELDKKNPEIKESKGCFKLIVNNKDIMVLR